MATSALSSSVFLFLTAMSAGMWKRLSNSPKTKSKDLAKGVFLAVVVLALFGSQLKSGNGDKWNSVSRESLQQFHDMNYTLASCHNVKTASRNNDSAVQPNTGSRHVEAAHLEQACDQAVGFCSQEQPHGKTKLLVLTSNKTQEDSVGKRSKAANRKDGFVFGCRDATEASNKSDERYADVNVQRVMVSPVTEEAATDHLSWTRHLFSAITMIGTLAVGVFIGSQYFLLDVPGSAATELSETQALTVSKHKSGPVSSQQARSNTSAAPVKRPTHMVKRVSSTKLPTQTRDAAIRGLKMSPKNPTKKQPASSRNWKVMTDEEIINQGADGGLALYSLEKVLEDPARAVTIRRRMVAQNTSTQATSQSLAKSSLPYENFDYAKVLGACCENVIGFLPLPVGLAGPLHIDGTPLFIPMATTEGVLVASTNRGCTAINASGGVTTALLDDGMTRGPALRFPSLSRAATVKRWLDSQTGYDAVEEAFNSMSRYGRLRSVKATVAGSDVFVRFKATTGDAMGMNMISKGVEAAITAIATVGGFTDMHVLSLSGNFCTDKKSAAVNWVDGRGKTVSAQATIAADVLRRVLKTDVDTLVELNTSKNLVGSAVAGAMGGFNAHAANIVSAVFLATGQDPAQNVESSSCLTVMKKNSNGDFEISVSMPSIEVGTVGGGTILEPQGAMLDLLGVRGADRDMPGANAQRLACIVAAAVLAGELSLCSALAAGSLVQSHMAHNRKSG